MDFKTTKRLAFLVFLWGAGTYSYAMESMTEAERSEFLQESRRRRDESALAIGRESLAASSSSAAPDMRDAGNEEIENKIARLRAAVSCDIGRSLSDKEKQRILSGARVQVILTDGSQEQRGELYESEHRKQFIGDLIWYWYALAYMRGQHFEKGTFVIYDSSGRLFPFLETFSGATERNSTHFVEYYKLCGLGDPSLSMVHKGLDFDEQDSPLPYLKTKKQAILFGKLNKENLSFFVKPQDFGYQTWSKWTRHSLATFSHLGKRAVFGRALSSVDEKRELVSHELISLFTRLC